MVEVPPGETAVVVAVVVYGDGLLCSKDVLDDRDGVINGGGVKLPIVKG